MELILTDLIYQSLTSTTVSIIGLFIPFMGAYWLYKQTIKTNAEVQLFEIGREIANILQKSSSLKSQFYCNENFYIDSFLEKYKEFNREKATHELLKNVLFHHGNELKGQYLTENERANLFIAIISYRFNNFVPKGVNWSGRGRAYWATGVEITTQNTSFPFGTKLYEKWITDFSLYCNDLWMCFESFEQNNFIQNYVDMHTYIRKEKVESWISGVKETTYQIKSLHSKCISQIQIIENSANTKQLLKDLIFCSVYTLLLAFSGYYIPNVLSKSQLLSFIDLNLCVFSSTLCICLIIYRITNGSKTQPDYIYLRRREFLEFFNKIKPINGVPLECKFIFFQHIVSLKNELRLPESYIFILQECIDSIKNYNKSSIDFMKDMNPILKTLESQFSTNSKNPSSFGINIQQLPDKGYDFHSLFNRIKGDELNFYISYNGHHFSRALIEINLKELNNEKKSLLCKKIIQYHKDSSKFDSFKSLQIQNKKLLNLISKLKQKTKKLEGLRSFEV